MTGAIFIIDSLKTLVSNILKARYFFFSFAPTTSRELKILKGKKNLYFIDRVCKRKSTTLGVLKKYRAITTAGETDGSRQIGGGFAAPRDHRERRGVFKPLTAQTVIV